MSLQQFFNFSIAVLKTQALSLELRLSINRCTALQQQFAGFLVVFIRDGTGVTFYIIRAENCLMQGSPAGNKGWISAGV